MNLPSVPTPDWLVLGLVQKIEDLEDEIQNLKNLEWERIAGGGHDGR